MGSVEINAGTKNEQEQIGFCRAAGHLLERHLDRDCGICKRCFDRWYKSQPNNEPYCSKCRICEGVFEYEKNCTATSNAVCKCVPGKKCVGENCEKCEKLQCKAGQELIKGKCMNCPYGKFNPGTDGECQTWKSCENGNILLNGTSSSDVVCGGIVTKTTERSTTTSVTSTEVKSNSEVYNIGMLIAYIAIPLVLMLFAMMIISRHILICVEKMKSKLKRLPVQPNQPIQQILIKIPDQEDACSCHYPEEEQGNEQLN
uniref:TNF receptor superfamily member 9 n=1 Tax=Leptobrachium leishanense TaxID=445787 RepID=A0A8C5WA56_9ANUR